MVRWELGPVFSAISFLFVFARAVIADGPKPLGHRMTGIMMGMRATGQLGSYLPEEICPSNSSGTYISYAKDSSYL